MITTDSSDERCKWKVEGFRAGVHRGMVSEVISMAAAALQSRTHQPCLGPSIVMHSLSRQDPPIICSRMGVSNMDGLILHIMDDDRTGCGRAIPYSSLGFMSNGEISREGES